MPSHTERRKSVWYVFKEQLRQVLRRKMMKTEEHWEILDDNGRLYAGTKTEMIELFYNFFNGKAEMPACKGDIVLIRVIPRMVWRR